MELPAEFLFFVGVGLLAQLVDGALGMAFGLVGSSILLALGLPPATVSASIHAAEVVTTGVSGGAHALLGNVDRRLFTRLVIPGAIGGAIGALLLSHADAELVRPLVTTYLLLLGLLLLLRAIGRRIPRREVRRVPLLGFVAGLLDAIGGGGWGPVATSTLIAHGGPVRQSIGSVNAAEFLVTLTISLTFFSQIGLQHWDVILGLLTGGAVAAPLSALLVKHAPERGLMGAVGALVMLLSAVQLGAWLLG